MPLSALTVDYPVHTRVLDNGLRVVVSPDRSTPIVAVNLWYDVGSRDERSGETGWAHLFEHLMFSGSAHVAPGEHMRALQNVGGVVNGSTWFDRTNYYQTVPTGALELALWLEADRLATLADHLDAGRLDTQRDVVKEEKRQRYDNVPYGDTLRHLVELLFPADHPYAHVTIGAMADLDAATAGSAREFFARHYRPDNLVLTMVGDLTPTDGFTRAERAFGWIARPAARPARPVTPALPPLDASAHRDLTEAVPAEAVYLAWRLPVRDTAESDAADLALAILGQGQTSRLHQRLVRGNELAAAASASSLGLIAGNSIGLLSARARPGARLDDLVDAVADELERFVAEGPTPAELARARAQYEREWLTELAHPDARADQLSAYTILHGDPGRVNRRRDEVARLDLAAVAGAASLLLPETAAVLRYRKGNGDAA